VDVSGQRVQEGFFLDCLTLEYGRGALSRNVGNYKSTLSNIPEERRSVLENVNLKCKR
jgi:hypothetical protein